MHVPLMLLCATAMHVLDLGTTVIQVPCLLVP
jgi:hypothetical protein